MRDILFRGKRTDNGEWEEGDLFHNHDGRVFVGELVVDDDLDARTASRYTLGIAFAEVIPETVGQYTGLADKNGKKIFEGDLLDLSILGKDHTLEKVVIQNACVGYEPVFPDEVPPSDRMWASFWRQEEQELWPSRYFTIVGNIYDNPELLEVTDHA